MGLRNKDDNVILAKKMGKEMQDEKIRRIEHRGPSKNMVSLLVVPGW